MKPGRNQSTRRKKTPANKLPKKRKKAKAAKDQHGGFGRTKKEVKRIADLAKSLSVRELAGLRRAISGVESREAKRRTFHRIAVKHGVSSGDLELALNFRLRERIYKTRPSSREKKPGST